LVSRWARLASCPSRLSTASDCLMCCDLALTVVCCTATALCCAATVLCWGRRTGGAREVGVALRLSISLALSIYLSLTLSPSQTHTHTHTRTHTHTHARTHTLSLSLENTGRAREVGVALDALGQPTLQVPLPSEYGTYKTVNKTVKRTRQSSV